MTDNNGKSVFILFSSSSVLSSSLSRFSFLCELLLTVDRTFIRWVFVKYFKQGEEEIHLNRLKRDIYLLLKIFCLICSKKFKYK